VVLGRKKKKEVATVDITCSRFDEYNLDHEAAGRKGMALGEHQVILA
jgi:hypothetical protein